MVKTDADTDARTDGQTNGQTDAYFYGFCVPAMMAGTDSCWEERSRNGEQRKIEEEEEEKRKCFLWFYLK